MQVFYQSPVTLYGQVANMSFLSSSIMCVRSKARGIHVQVRVESSDDHDRTREFVWRRSSTIAHLVSQKLLSATRSMLQPPPKP